MRGTIDHDELDVVTGVEEHPIELLRHFGPHVVPVQVLVDAVDQANDQLGVLSDVGVRVHGPPHVGVVGLERRDVDCVVVCDGDVVGAFVADERLRSGRAVGRQATGSGPRFAT